MSGLIPYDNPILEEAVKNFMGNWYNDGPLQIQAQNYFRSGYCNAFSSPIVIAMVEAMRKAKSEFEIISVHHKHLVAWQMLRESIVAYEELLK